MTEEQARTAFQELLDEFIITQNVTKGQWFSLPAMKINGKIFAAQWLNGDMVFKLNGDVHARALALAGATLFQPLEDRGPMKAWVQVPPQHADHWREFALSALDYVKELTTK